MKMIILTVSLAMFSLKTFAYESLECSDINDPSLIYSVQRIVDSEKYLLSVMQGMKVTYTETLKFRDWQGEGEYKGRYSVIINNGAEFVSFSHKGFWLKSTKLKCEAL